MSQYPTDRPSPALQTSGAELLLAAFRALSADEQDQALRLMTDARLERDAEQGSETARFIASLVRAHEVAGPELSPGAYKAAQRHLQERGIEIEPIGRVIRHFGSWRRAKEALALSASESTLRIETRFRSRRLGKVWRYTEETLRDTVSRCASDLGHVPQVAEFDFWRQRELELAEAQGNDALHLPSAGPYRRRYGSWELALLHFGFTSDQVAERLERP